MSLETEAYIHLKRAIEELKQLKEEQDEILQTKTLINRYENAKVWSVCSVIDGEVVAEERQNLKEAWHDLKVLSKRHPERIFTLIGPIKDMKYTPKKGFQIRNRGIIAD